MHILGTLAAAGLTLAAQCPAQTNDWTVLFYACSDNDSEESFCPDIDDARRGLHSTPGMEVFCLVDRSPDHSSSTLGFGEDFDDTRLYELRHDSAVRLAGGQQFPQITTDSSYEADTGSAVTLRKYLRWAKANHPAKHYALVFYSHGNGAAWCPDETDGSEMRTPALHAQLDAEDSLDLVVFDVCSMAGIENAYEWRPRPDAFGVDVVVATPMAGFPFPWEDIFSRIDAKAGPSSAPHYDPATMTPLQFGALVVDATEQQRKREIASSDIPAELVEIANREAMTCLDLRQASKTKAAVDVLAQALAAHDGGLQILAKARSEGEGAIDYSMNHIDLHHLATRLTDVADAEIADAARQVCATTDALVSASYGLEHYGRYGGFQAGSHGVYIVLPSESDSEEACHRLLEWYRPEAHDKRPDLGSYSWCRDGATPGNDTVDNWFELLDHQFDKSNDAGGYNGYRH